MVSGTSTGSLLTTAVVLPNPENPSKNKFWAVNASDIYEKNGNQVFRTFQLPLWGRILGTIGFVIFGGLLGYCIGVRKYYNPEYEKTMTSFHNYIKERRKQVKSGNSPP